MSKPIDITDQEFQTRVLESDAPVLVDFWAPWCGPCRIVGPTLEQIASERGERLVVAKINIDEHNQSAGRLGVQSIPTMILYSDGRERARIVGALDKATLERRIDEALAASNVG